MAATMSAARRSPGGRPVGGHELSAFLRECVREEPLLRTWEGFVPKDPRDVVFARAAGTLLRLFPGSIERPVADIARWEVVAKAVDPVLISRLGLGVSQYVNVALRYTDHALGVLESSWPTSEDLNVLVTATEIEATATLMETPIPWELLDIPEIRARQPGQQPNHRECFRST